MGPSVSDRASMKVRWGVHKFHDPDGQIARASRAGADIATLGPYEHDTILDNCTLIVGYQHLIDLIAGTGTGVPWDSANAHIGIGDGSDPVEPGQTGLLGVNKTYRPMDATFPHRQGKAGYWRATFGPEDGNHLWAEYAIANGPGAEAVHLNRKVQVRYEKLRGDTWVMDLEILFGKEEA